MSPWIQRENRFLKKDQVWGRGEIFLEPDLGQIEGEKKDFADHLVGIKRGWVTSERSKENEKVK